MGSRVEDNREDGKADVDHATGTFDVVLADPPACSDDYDRAYPNLGLLQLLSYLRVHTPLADGQIHLLDQFHTVDDHVRLVEQHRPKLYGISFAFLTQRIAYKTINELKRRFPDMVIVAGGSHATAAPNEVYDRCEADIICLGEGELPLADIVREMVRGTRDFSTIPGLVLRAPSGPTRTGAPRVVPNITALPLAAWDRVTFSRFAGQHYRKSEKQACIAVSRGCPHRCTFCSLPVWRAARPNVRVRSPESIAREVTWLYRLGVREIKIVSDEINVSLPWAKSVCRAIGDLGYKDLYFQTNLRADQVDDEFIQLLGRMNVWLVHLGVESANDRVLAGIRKKITVKQTEACLELLHRQGIRVLAFMMAFQLWEDNGQLQHETMREIRHSLWWTWKQFLRGRLSYMTWSIATPMPGAELQEVVDRHGLGSSTQILDNWNRNKDYLGIDLTSIGITERMKMRMLRIGILTKALFMLVSGHFGWRRHFFRAGILLRSFLGRWNARPRDKVGPILNTSLTPKTEG